MTTQQLCKILGRSGRTLKLYRQGYRTIAGNKVWLLPDHSTLPANWVKSKDSNVMRWEYNLAEVMVWINKLRASWKN